MVPQERLLEVSQTSVVGNRNLPKPSLHRIGLQCENWFEGMVKGTVSLPNTSFASRAAVSKVG